MPLCYGVCVYACVDPNHKVRITITSEYVSENSISCANVGSGFREPQGWKHCQGGLQDLPEERDYLMLENDQFKTGPVCK